MVRYDEGAQPQLIAAELIDTEASRQGLAKPFWCRGCRQTSGMGRWQRNVQAEPIATTKPLVPEKTALNPLRHNSTLSAMGTDKLIYRESRT